MINQPSFDPTDQLTDYVLELLTPTEREQVQKAVQNDDQLQAELAQEAAIGQAVRQTLTQITQPSPIRLKQLRPPIPQKRRWFMWGQMQWATAVAVTSIALFLFVWLPQPNTPNNSNDGLIAITATSTQEVRLIHPTSSASPTPVIEPDVVPSPTPSPNPTPIAALGHPIPMNSN